MISGIVLYSITETKIVQYSITEIKHDIWDSSVFNNRNKTLYQ